MAVAGLLVAAGLGPVASASAHSQLEATDPVDGSQLAALPDQVTMTFNQNVLGLGTVLDVTGPTGNMATGKPKVIDNQVIQPVQAGSPAGAYTVLWRVTSADGHPISGQFGFTAVAGNGGTAPAVSAASAGDPQTTDKTDEGSGRLVFWVLLIIVLVLIVVGIALSRRGSRRSSGVDGVDGGTDSGSQHHGGGHHSGHDSGSSDSGSSDSGGSDGGGGGGGD
jgi:methionine-rich copper-binding protein CopC